MFFQVRVVISADAPHTELFIGHGSDEDHSIDEKRMLMDDLNIQHGSVSLLKETNIKIIYIISI